jgi:hypothetical protein
MVMHSALYDFFLSAPGEPSYGPNRGDLPFAGVLGPARRFKACFRLFLSSERNHVYFPFISTTATITATIVFIGNRHNTATITATILAVARRADAMRERSGKHGGLARLGEKCEMRIFDVDTATIGYLTASCGPAVTNYGGNTNDATGGGYEL